MKAQILLWTNNLMWTFSTILSVRFGHRFRSIDQRPFPTLLLHEKGAPLLPFLDSLHSYGAFSRHFWSPWFAAVYSLPMYCLQYCLYALYPTSLPLMMAPVPANLILCCRFLSKVSNVGWHISWKFSSSSANIILLFSLSINFLLICSSDSS